MNDNSSERKTPALESFAGIEFLESIPSALPLPRFAIKFLVKFLNTLEDALGLKLGFQIPDYFLSYQPELWEGLLAVRKLHEVGVASYFTKIFKVYEDDPNLFAFYIKLKDTTTSGMDGSGYDFFSPKRALWSAIGEAVERYSLHSYLPKEGEYKEATFNQIKTEALDIFAVAGISPEQREAGNLHFLMKYDENSKFRWVHGYSLTRRKKIFVPLQLVSFAYSAPYEKKEPLIIRLVSTGAAAHKTLEEAVLNGLLEVIQRDAFMITWVNKLVPISLDMESFPEECEVRKIFAVLKNYGLEPHLLYLPSDMSVHTILCVIIDKSGIGPAVAVGASSGFDILSTSAAAISESYITHRFVRKKLEILKRDDVSLLPDKNTLDREGRLVWWSVPERLNDILFLLQGEKKKLSELPKDNFFQNPRVAINFLAEYMDKKNLEVVYTEILEKKFQEQLGLKSVMVTVPGMQPLHLDESIPYFYGKRLRGVPRELGLEAQSELNPLPHPFP